MEKSRVFLSLNVPGIIVPKLSVIQEHLKTELKAANVKWEDPAKFHLTLRFLGDVKTGDISSLMTVLRRLKFEFDEIRFAYTGIGFFPDSNYPNVVYAGLKEKGANSAKLVEFIDKIIYNFGVKPDKRFIPHITMGRFRKDKRVKLEKIADAHFEPFEMRFSSFYLMESKLGPAGSAYNVIDEFEFIK